MSKSIRISPKHGVNPLIPICFWCGEEKQEIALLGRLKNDAEAPRNVLLNYEPCEKCKKLWDNTNVLIGVTPTPNFEDQPYIAANGPTKLYPTGRYIGLSEKSVRNLFEPDTADNILNSKGSFVDDTIITQLTENIGYDIKNNIETTNESDNN